MQSNTSPPCLRSVLILSFNVRLMKIRRTACVACRGTTGAARRRLRGESCSGWGQKAEEKRQDLDRDGWKMRAMRCRNRKRRGADRKRITENLTSVLKEAKVVTWPVVSCLLKLSALLGSHFLFPYCVVLVLQWRIKMYIKGTYILSNLLSCKDIQLL
jgi:hypothetical protein